MTATASRITRNFQVTIPKEVRESEGFKVGDEVLFVVEKDHRVRMVKNDRDEILTQAAGIWKDMKEDSVEYVRKLRAEWKKREDRNDARR